MDALDAVDALVACLDETLLDCRMMRNCKKDDYPGKLSRNQKVRKTSIGMW